MWHSELTAPLPISILLICFQGATSLFFGFTPGLDERDADADADLIIRDPVAHSFEQIMNELK